MNGVSCDVVDGLCRRVLLACVAVCGLVLVVSSSAFAVFTRPFLRQITRAENPSGLSCSAEGKPASSCIKGGSQAGGVAVDSLGNLWVGDGEEALVEFNSSGEFVPPTVKFEEALNENGQSDITPPESLAIDHSTGHFYVTGAHDRHVFSGFVEVFEGTGKLCKRWSRFKEAHVAVDNSIEPLAGPVYVSHGDVNPSPSSGDGLPRGVEKFDVNASCEPTPAPFTFSAGYTAGYLEGNQIVGTPSGKFYAAGGSPQNVAVDSHGAVYVVGTVLKGSLESNEEVLEYEASGKFVRAFTGEGTPGLGESHQDGGWGAVHLGGVAVDPVSGDVLVAVNEPATDEGAVDEFDSSGRFLKQITEAEIETLSGVRKPSRLHGAFEMAVGANGDLYVGDVKGGETPERVVDVYGPGHLLPGVKIAEASKRERTSAVVNGSVNPEGLSLSDCHFEYVTGEAFVNEGFSKPGLAECEPSASQISKEANLEHFYPVQGRLHNLAPGNTYRYRLVATTAGGLGGSEASTPLAFTTPAAPTIDSASAGNLSSTFADLHAEIDALGAATNYHFEYDTSEYTPNGPAHGTSVPVPNAGIGAGGPTGSADASVVEQIAGLTPGTTYHFRVVAENEVGVTQGIAGEHSQGTFTTLAQSLPGLPDKRAYELITPPNKGSSSDLFAVQFLESQFYTFNNGYPTDSGDGFLLEAGGAAFGSFPNAGIFDNTYVFSRTAPAVDGSGGEWSFTSLASPSLGAQEATSPILDPTDLSGVVFDDSVGALGSVSGERPMVLLGRPGGPYTTLYTSIVTVHPGQESSERTVALGASHNLNRVVLGSLNHKLAPGDSEQDAGSEALYEWKPVGVDSCTDSSASFSEGAHGCLALININSEGSLLNRCGAEFGQFSRQGRTYKAVSADGSKVFFTAPDIGLRYNPATPATREATQECWNGAAKNTPQLYVRSGGQTLEVSAPEEGVSDPSGSHPAVYVGASEGGSKVFFFTETELTREAKEFKLHDPELYECEIYEEAGAPKCKLTRVSAGEEGRGSTGAHIFAVPAVSADGSAVYFMAFGALTMAAQPLKEGTSFVGSVNLYRYDTVSDRTVFVAKINERNYPSTYLVNWWGKPLGEAALAPNANWYVTPDGNHLLFGSEVELTGQSTAEGSRCNGVDSFNSAPDGHCTEIYRYSYEPGSDSGGNVMCVSCDPSGANPVSNAVFGTFARRTTADAGPVRAMSDDGSYVFFDTADPLVSSDSNKTLDVYEWEAQGKGGCELAGGCVHLISSGTDSTGSYFLGMSPDGRNAFFGTHASLVPQDIDTYGDLYDARICEPENGNPCIKPPGGGTGQCAGDACQTLPSSPIDATPTSLTFSGAGNVRPGEGSGAKQKSLTRAQQLAKALKACRRLSKRKRVACEAQARKRYRVKSKAKRSRSRAGRSGRARRARGHGRGGQ